MKDSIQHFRRSAINSIPSLCQVWTSNSIIGEIIRQGLSEIITDDNETIRVAIPPCLYPIAQKIPQSERLSLLIPIAKTLEKDSSWWVRANTAKVFGKIILLESDIIGNDIRSIILHFSRDVDPEVRTASIASCQQCIEVLSKNQNYFVEAVLPVLEDLASDKVKQVRAELVSDLLYFAQIPDPASTKERIFPLIGQLLVDSERDVIGNVLKSLVINFSKVDSFSLTQVLLPKLIEISLNSDWRVKIEIIRSLLFSSFVTLEAVSTYLVPIIGRWLQDSAYAVRQQSSKILPDFLNLVKNETIQDEFLNLILRLNCSGIYTASNLLCTL
jgi:serine/threonine-protein phosphatase 2A regulatory subunit A